MQLDDADTSRTEAEEGQGEVEGRLGYAAVPELDHALALDAPSIDDYLAAASSYVLNGRLLPTRETAESKSAKAAQAALSRVLGTVLAGALRERHRELIIAELGEDVLTGPRGRRPHLLDPVAGEKRIAGGLRTAQSDVTEAHDLDGVRLAVEIKPSYRAVGRAIWNRYGDVRAFAVNVHLKFPFAVVGGIQVLPTVDIEEDSTRTDPIGYLQRAVRRQERIRPRVSEADADHLVEALGLLIFNPDAGELHPDLPSPGSRVRWDGFVSALVESYDARFGAESD